MNKRLIKQKIAFIMAIVIMLGTILPADTVHATANEKKITQDTSGTQNIQNGISVDGKNAFGNMLGKELLGKATEQAENDGCNIFSVEMDGQTAKVSFETIESAALVIGIYSEDGTELVTSAKKNVSAGETETEVTIGQTLPQYFYLRGFLVDSKTLRPLCTSYETPNYTKEMQEFLAKTVNDFDSDKVLNLDSNPDNNFAVYDTDTIIIPEKDGVNKVTKTDDENLVYVIENADESITSLKKDDIFSYQYGDGEVLVIKIASIVKDGTTVTITGADISLEEAFDYVKIDAKAGTEDAKVDKSMMEGGLTYNGLVDEGAKGGLRKSGKFGEIDKEGHTGKSLEYKLNDIETDSGNVKISGGININFDISFKINISLRYQYCELKLDYSVKVHASITGKLPPFKIAIGYIAVDPVPGVVGIGFIPYFNLEASGEIEYTGTLSGTVGACASNKTGLENLTTNPKFESEIKGEITVFAGIEIEPIITLFHKKTDKYLKIQAAAGCEVHALFIKAKADNPDKIHACKNCISGEIYGKLKLDINSEFIKNGIHKSPEVKISDFYYSFDFNEFSFKTCPHYKLKADIIVTDSDGKGLKDVTIKGPFSVNKNGQDKIAEYAKDLTDADHITTNAMGKAFGYLTTGEHTLELNADGYEAQNEKIEVKDETNNLRIMLKKSSTLPDVKPSAIPIESLVTEPPAIPSLNPDSLSTTADIMISLGEYHSGAVTKDGSLYMWGCNDHGQLGDNTITDKNKPVKVLDNVVSVSLGGEHSGAITKDGSLYMWGLNNCGQLGDGTVADAHKPVKVLDNVALVSLGYEHSGAVTKDGSLYMWGYNGYGQLGDGTETDKHTPVKVLDNVASVSLGGKHSGAVTKDGSLYMWGYNCYGQLGDGTRTDKNTPVKVLDNVASVSLGGYHSGAVTKDGSLYMWGNNSVGCLGDGTNTDKHTPVKVLNNVASVSLGDEYRSNYSGYREDGESGAVTKDGSLYMWGSNYYLQLGIESTDRPTKMFDNVISVSLGGKHSGAVTKDGSLYMWGSNGSGQLGDGTTIYKSTPVKITFEDSVSAASYRSKPLRGASTLSESFTGLLPNKYYNVYVLKSRSAKNLLSADNVLYMAQYTTDSTGKIDVTYNINKTSEYDKPFVVGMSRMDLSDADVKVKDLIYSGKEQSIWPEVSYNGKKLSEREDYNVSGDVNVTDIGEYSITISGTGMYKGSITIAYKVKSPDGSMPSKTFVPSEDTSGDKATAAPSEDTSGDKATSTPSEDTSSDKATDAPSPSSVVTAPGTIPVTIVTDGAISVPTAAPSTVPLPSMTPEPFSRPDYDDKYEYDTYPGYDSSSSGYDSSSSGYDSSSSDNITVKLGKNTFIYNGKAKKPKVTVKQGSYKLIKNRDYTLTYSNNVNVGTASVTVWGRGDYSGYILKKFTIIPKGTSFSGKIKAGHRSFTAKWKKRSKSVTGYQLQYSSNKKFNGKTTKTIKKKSVTKLKAGNLKAGKKYYIRVRTYKTVKGRKYCSKWSKTKIVKTKR